MSSCVILLIVAFIRGRNRRTAKVKAQRVVLACAYFDDEGKLMVTQEGTLPSEKITNHYVEKVSMFCLSRVRSRTDDGLRLLARTNLVDLTLRTCGSFKHPATGQRCGT